MIHARACALAACREVSTTPAHAAFIIDAIDPATLGRVCFRESNQGNEDREYTVAHCVLHAVEHAQEHLGQSYLTRQLWEARASSSP